MGIKSEADFKKLEYEDMKKRVFDLIVENKGNPEIPTKEDLIYVVGELKRFTLKFRNPCVVEKHAGEIMELINRL